MDHIPPLQYRFREMRRKIKGKGSNVTIVRKIANKILPPPKKRKVSEHTFEVHNKKCSSTLMHVCTLIDSRRRGRAFF